MKYTLIFLFLACTQLNAQRITFRNEIPEKPKGSINWSLPADTTVELSPVTGDITAAWLLCTNDIGELWCMKGYVSGIRAQAKAEMEMKTNIPTLIYLNSFDLKPLVEGIYVWQYKEIKIK